MSNRILELIKAYRNRPESARHQSLWEFVAGKDPYVFSHHPATQAFRDHVWRIGGLYWCKGCVVTFAGIVVGILFFLVTGWLRRLTDGEVGIVFLGLLLPTLLLAVFNLPRWYRHVSRFLLGFLVASAFVMLFVTDSWLVRIVIVAAYFGVRIPMERKRSRENRQLADRT